MITKLLGGVDLIAAAVIYLPDTTHIFKAGLAAVLLLKGAISILF